MKHWTETEFLRWLYTGDGDAGHLDVCPECRSRAQAMTERRESTTKPPEVSWEFLAAQRRGIYRRLDSPQRWFPRHWAVASASLVCVVGLSLAALRPGLVGIRTSDDAPLYSTSEVKLFSDLASIDQSDGPKAIEPLRNLFQDGTE